MAVGNQVYNLSDYLKARSVSGDNIYYSFRFDNTPLIQLRNGDVIVESGKLSGRWLDVTGYDGIPFILYYYPLGAANVNHDILYNGIYIGDFVPEALVRFAPSVTLNVRFEQVYLSDERYEFSYTCHSAYYFYDSNGDFISEVSNTTGEVLSYLSPGNSDPVITSWVVPFGERELLVPEGAAYVTPYYWFQIEANDYHQSAYIAAVQTVYNSITFSVGENQIVRQSVTMDAINDKLADLNDKADTIINGTDDQQDIADNTEQSANNSAQDIDEALDRLDELERYDTSSAIETITTFLQDPGWASLQFLLKPLLEWSHTSTIMLIVVAFSTMSLLFFGR